MEIRLKCYISFLSKIDQGLTHSEIRFSSANVIHISNSRSAFTKENSKKMMHKDVSEDTWISGTC